MIINNVKEPMEKFRQRTLYKIEQVYSDGSSYHGFYVESKAGKAQAYRYKTIDNNGNENVEDQKALEKARYTLKHGFTF